MFDDVAVDMIPAVKKRRLTHAQKKIERSNPKILQITALVDDIHHVVKVLSPSHPRDRLWISLAPSQVTAVINYIRSSPFEDDQVQQHDAPAWLRISGVIRRATEQIKEAEEEWQKGQAHERLAA